MYVRVSWKDFLFIKSNKYNTYKITSLKINERLIEKMALQKHSELINRDTYNESVRLSFPFVVVKYFSNYFLFC